MEHFEIPLSGDTKRKNSKHKNSLIFIHSAVLIGLKSIDVGGFQAMARVSGLPELKTTQFLRFVSFKKCNC